MTAPWLPLALSPNWRSLLRRAMRPLPAGLQVAMREARNAARGRPDWATDVRRLRRREQDVIVCEAIVTGSSFVGPQANQPPLFGLTGRAAVITGGTGMLGLPHAEALAQDAEATVGALQALEHYPRMTRRGGWE